MMNCRDVALALSSGEAEAAPLRLHAAMVMHLAMCRHCRAFRRQLRRFTALVHASTRAVENEPSSSFEARLVDRMGAP